MTLELERAPIEMRGPLESPASIRAAAAAQLARADAIEAQQLAEAAENERLAALSLAARRDAPDTAARVMHWRDKGQSTWRVMPGQRPSTAPPPTVSTYTARGVVSALEIDRLESMLYESVHQKVSSMRNEVRTLSETLNSMDRDGDGFLELREFVKAMERFGLHVDGHGCAGHGGLPEALVLGFFGRYDTEGSGRLNARLFVETFLGRQRAAFSIAPGDGLPPTRGHVGPLDGSEEARAREWGWAAPEYEASAPEAEGAGRQRQDGELLAARAPDPAQWMTRERRVTRIHQLAAKKGHWNPAGRRGGRD